MKRNRTLGLGILGAVLVALLALALACGAEATPTPAAPATPVPPVAPTAAPAATATLVPGAPTPVPSLPTPTRILPTPTPVVTGEIQYGGTLRYVELLGDTLDPHHTVKAETYSKLWAIYNQLLNLDPDGNLVPELAESWDYSSDGKVITFHLREGVKFHDGTDFNAQAVKFNFDRMMDPDEFSPRRAELTPYVESVEVVGDLTVAINLYDPVRPLLSTLGSDRMGFMVSPTAVEKYGEDYGPNPAGTGPFTLTEWQIDMRITLTRSDSYWDEGKPYLDGIIYSPVPDASMRLAMLRTGEADMIDQIRPSDLPLIQDNPDLELGRITGYRKHALHFNPSIAPFDNQALRQAIAYAVDGQQFADAMYPGAGRRTYVLETIGFAYNPDLKPIVFDQEKSRQKLAEAGYAGGVTIPMAFRADESEIAWGEVIQAMLAEVGIKTDAKMILRADYYKPENGHYETIGFAPSAVMARRADPHINIQRYFHSEGGNNYGGGYSNPEVDRLIEEAVTAYDQAKARALYSRIQTIIVGEDAVHVPYTERDEFFPHHRTVKGYVPYIHGRTLIRDLWFEK